MFTVAAQDAADAAQVPTVYRPLYDFTGDARTDFTNLVVGAVGQPITWKTLRNPADPAPGAAFIRIFDFGLVGDSLTPHDFLGDGKTELGVWRTGVYYESPFPENTPVGPLSTTNWGLTAAENPGREGDYDGDGKDDETIIRVQSNILNWWIHGSAGTDRVVSFGRVNAGFSTLAFQGADYTGDGRDELIMCNASTGTGANQWWIGDSITGAVVATFNFGNFITDYFVNPDDYTGDARADIVVYRAGSGGADGGFWFVRDAVSGNIVKAVKFGIPDPNFTDEDIPVRGNYDGDNIADIAVFRRSTKTYYWLSSATNTVFSQQWGDPANPDEFPLANLFTF